MPEYEADAAASRRQTGQRDGSKSEDREGDAGVQPDAEDPEKGLMTPKTRAAFVLSSKSSITKSREALHTVLSSWVSRRFFQGCAVLFPLVVTVWITWWFLTFFDNFFSPLYQGLFGFHVFGLGFVTSMAFIIGTGMFVSSWLGGLVFQLGEWIIKKVPLVKHIYSTAKQVSAAVNPGTGGQQSFQECVLIRHPRHGEYAFAFITGNTVLQTEGGERELLSVFVPTNHIYIGDIFLLAREDVLHTNLSVREGLEIVVSVGLGVPPRLLCAQQGGPLGVPHGAGLPRALR